MKRRDAIKAGMLAAGAAATGAAHGAMPERLNLGLAKWGGPRLPQPLDGDKVNYLTERTVAMLKKIARGDVEDFTNRSYYRLEAIKELLDDWSMHISRDERDEMLFRAMDIGEESYKSMDKIEASRLIRRYL